MSRIPFVCEPQSQSEFRAEKRTVTKALDRTFECVFLMKEIYLKKHSNVMLQQYLEQTNTVVKRHIIVYQNALKHYELKIYEIH